MKKVSEQYAIEFYCNIEEVKIKLFIVESISHRCGASDSMRACHATGPGSIPDRDRFPG